MLYAILCYAAESVVGAWSKQTEESVLAHRKLVQGELRAQGKLGPVARLMPTTTAVTVRGGTTPTVIDGPFAETKEQLLGLYFVECATLEEAVDVARKLAKDSGVLEVRPLRTFDRGALP